ncbi:ABC transporter ATP-binding protein [Edaphobacter sp. 12200R-103]|uniref:ABC transporter ATP-binding protein n=1 Tax=Edaphobacter sp. 12200R-103 TaxID=2703788 RepID=UPI00138BFEDD|nr:ABC transporter ATP-binding protein [Edaphobacter sp. 12200R-103]QHS52800.1 ABC transporter ATP-binding protein [Edaphobacter sp. 12200R-103]
MIPERVIQTSELTKKYGSFCAVNQLNLSVRAERITGFLGRNGAGKSSTIKMLLGMVHPTSGSGTVLGYRIDDRRQSIEIRRRIAYVGEDKGLYGYMTVAELIRFTRSFYSDWQADIERRLLAQYRLPPGRKVKALSKGMRTKLALLLALARRPALLILDEPTEGLDPVSIEELLQTLATAPANGTSVFFSSHQLSEVERIADDILMVDRGSVVLDMSLEQIRENYRRISFGFSTAVPQIEPLLGVEKMRCEGRQVTIVASSNAEAIAQMGRERGAVEVSVLPLTLREIFLETVQERNRDDQQRHREREDALV